MKGWKKIPFDEAVADESGGNLKTPQSEFLSDGDFAVVDQGKELVAGYVNDRARLCRSPSPVVVFGDHTRCIKFVDFPFCMGADGIKVLRLKVEGEIKYLYHFLRQLNIPDGGYDRHFKYLKRAEVVLPPLGEQRRIAEVLDRAEALRFKRRAALAELDSLTQSLFLDLFGDPVTNSKGWPETASLGESADIASGITKGRKLNGEKVREVPYLAVANVQDRALNLNAIKSIEATEAEIVRYRLQINDLVLTEGGDPDKLGRGTLWNGELAECIHQNHIFRVRITTDRLLPLFANWLISGPRGKRYFLKSAKQTTGIASINMTQLRGFPMLFPPLSLQREFARRVTAVEALKTKQRASLAELDALFATLQHRAFRGEL